MSVSKIEWRNRFTAVDFVGRATFAVALHPFEYAKILIQLGYEPFEAYQTTTIFLRKRMALPGIFSYLKLICHTDGWTGLYRGLTYKICYSLIHQFVFVNTSDVLEQLRNNADTVDENDKTSSELQTVEKLFKNITEETICKVVSISVSYPFQVLLIRSCAQFIGKETVYDSMPSAIRNIYTNEGFLGFYAGFGPLIIGECLALWLSHSIVFIVERCIVRSGVSYDLQTYISTTTNYVVQSFMYPFHVVATVMSLNSCQSLTNSIKDPQFVNWVQCWQHLSSLGQLKRGSSLLFRYPVSVNQKPAPKSL
ncbi:mitochondrial carrier 2-like protein [Leptotrombidium deliense]|uniref:Mitochondrial carrier 2-like protein n=1 Tax=Leptotrombidium deliense TaxID=299467 RepID=A0A443SR06_9ACAR|nr:mitochondrial carrier 2-like protein [Leptotrombidium deliense]